MRAPRNAATRRRQHATRGSVRRLADLLLRLLLAAALVADAVVHIRQAPGYQLSNPEGLGEGNLFYLEAAAAILVALYVLLRGSELAYLAALLVAGSALTAVLLYRYVDVPALGPIPAMYEPVWFFEKTLSAVAEAAGVVLAVVGLAAGRRTGNAHAA